MKTYKATIEKPRLVIEHDEYTESPREWDNLGYFITQDYHYHSPNKHKRLQEIIKKSGEIAENQEDHIRLIKENYRTKEDHILAIYPINKYEHSGVIYRLGTAHGFDYSNNGFYIITKQSRKEFGKVLKKDFKKIIQTELDHYNQWISGEVYRFELYDENGELEDSCGGFFNIDDIKEHLPEEWKDEDMEEYIDLKLTNEW